MKKAFIIPVLALILLFTCCENNSKSVIYDNDFSNFTMDDDLSWLKGTWKLIKWEEDDNGVMEDDTHIYEYNYLKIAGGEKYSELVEESKRPGESEVSSSTYTVEGYFTLNSNQAGHSNKVNKNKNMLLLSREFALDAEVIFYYTYKKL